LTSQITGAIDWRREGIKYKRNEIYLDVFESVNLLMSSNGTILRNEVAGQVMMKTLLTGMPECKLGLNDKLTMQKGSETAGGKVAGQKRGSREVEIDDCTFHRCVRLGKFDADRTITFIPPDGEFELMKYRVTENITLPFKIMPAYQEQGTTRLSVTLKIASTFSPRLFATNLVIKIPVPPNTARCHINVPIGKAKHEPENHAIVWRVRKFQGKLERMLDAEVEMVKGTKEKAWSRPPIQIEFQVNYIDISTPVSLQEKKIENVLLYVFYVMYCRCQCLQHQVFMCVFSRSLRRVPIKRPNGLVMYLVLVNINFVSNQELFLLLL
jgi:AP-2 complex subunit mu-1